ncbi:MULTISPECIES: T9SS type A sorting domain-containing protein [unclassified Chryseobacterium]|uniref:T9SS type A sorting domain-containing protein n=1 Tax=unclassified Chryseobacterium TaxID=2593645 RepID=UPI000E0C718D|nr:MULTISPECIES: T9SS type A sorting domain-containing protein [unclassified Chryseobacterium]MDQ1856044.1 T9SS type A sorting domain-containing protein [Chryseobacterium sp. WLY505]
MKVQPELTFYPNPVKDFCYLKSKEKIKDIMVYDMAQRKLSDRKNLHVYDIQLDFSTYSKGVYMISILYENDRRESIKIMVK